MNKRKKAFTLAEVLITLGIIGIVAALTVPVLLQNVAKQQIETKLMKFYSTIKNIEDLSVSDNGQIDSWALAVGDGIDNFSTYYEPYLKYNQKITCTYSGNDPCRNFATYQVVNSTSTNYLGGTTAYFLLDGSILYSFNNIATSVIYMEIFIDLNGYSAPNQFGKDVFAFYITKNNQMYGFVPIATGTNPNYACSTGNYGWECAVLLAKNGWKFPNNYPAW